VKEPKNEIAFASTCQNNMVQQLNTIDAKDNNTKLVQFTTIFHLLNECKPMTGYKCANLYSSD